MSILLADIDATCASLGYNDGNKYYTEPDALPCLKHLIWILRRDLENHEYRRHIGRAEVLQTDLVPMLMNNTDNEEFNDVLIRLLIILTNPVTLLYRDGLPKDGAGRKIYLELIDISQKYKTAFTSHEIWNVMTSQLHKMLKIDWALRSEEQSITIERILVLIRNVLQIPSNPDGECRADNDASVHDEIIWALHQSGLLELIVYIISVTYENQFNLHALEIFCLLYREQTAESLANASLQRSATEKYRDEQELVSIRKREKQKFITKLPSGRHSRFGGTYVLQNVKSVSENDIICHQTLERAVSIDFDKEKSKQKRSHRVAGEENTVIRRSAFSVRLCLREYCMEVLHTGYNNLVQQVRRSLERGRDTVTQDDSYLLWAIRFFMEFNRFTEMQLDLVSESLSIQYFHWVLTRIQHHMDMMVSDKKNARIWSKRLHIGIQTFRELLLSLIALQKLKDEASLSLFNTLQNNICYVLEYRETILYLLMNYNETHSTKAYLRDVVEMANIFIKIMEKFCKDSVIVQDKKRGRKKKSKNTKKKTQKKSNNENENLEDKWVELASEIAWTLTENIQLPEESHPIPFDAASDKSIDDQKEDCMLRIHRFLKEEKFDRAIVLMRSAREVWPENDYFGAISSAPEDELMLLREIYFSKLGKVENKSDDENNYDNEEDVNDKDEEDEEEVEERMEVIEKDFSFEDFAKRLLNSRVVRACTIVLSDWEKIPTKSLKSAVTILHRIAFGCKCSAMLYQVSLFRIFQQVLHAPKDIHHEELRRLGVYVIRKFVETAPNNPKIYAELLFYKTLKESNDLENGYTDDYTTNIKGAWSEEQENQLRMLFEENQENPASDKDVIDWILENIRDKTRTRRAILKKLREMNLIFKAPTKRSNAIAAKKNLWRNEEDEQLRELYEEYRLEENCLDKILEIFGTNRSKSNVVKRMISLGLIANKSEIVPKKKQKKRNNNRQDEENSDNEDGQNNVGNQSGMSSKSKKRNRKSNKTRSQKRKKNVETPLHVGTIKNLLSQIDEKFQEAIDWLKECLTDAADDLVELPEDDDNDVPLVPLLDVQKEAMDNAQFTTLLIALGIQPPIQKTNNYWRIPIYLNAADLKMRVNVLNGNYLEPVDDINIENENKSRDSVDMFESRSSSSSSVESSSSESSDEENNLHENIMNKRRERVDNLVFNRSDNEDEYSQPTKVAKMKEKESKRIEQINMENSNKENLNSKRKRGKFNINEMIKDSEDEKNDGNKNEEGGNNDFDDFDSEKLRLRLEELAGYSDRSDEEREETDATTESNTASVTAIQRSRIRRNVFDSDSSDGENETVLNSVKKLTDTNAGETAVTEIRMDVEANNLISSSTISTKDITNVDGNKEREEQKVSHTKESQIDNDSKSKASNKRNRSTEDDENEEASDEEFNIKRKKSNADGMRRRRIAIIDEEDDDDDKGTGNGLGGNNNNDETNVLEDMV